MGTSGEEDPNLSGGKMKNQRTVTIDLNVLSRVVATLDGLRTTAASCAAHELRYNLVPEIPAGVSVLEQPKGPAA
jgi:hypothetical protein